MIDFESFTHLTFDCYGTLIDWENGILTAVAPVLKRNRISVGPDQVLRLFTKYEAEQEAKIERERVELQRAAAERAKREPRRVLRGVEVSVPGDPEPDWMGDE